MQSLPANCRYFASCSETRLSRPWIPLLRGGGSKRTSSDPSASRLAFAISRWLVPDIKRLSYLSTRGDVSRRTKRGRSPVAGRQYMPGADLRIVNPQTRGRQNFVKTDPICGLVEALEAAQPLNAANIGPSSRRSANSLTSRCGDRGSVTTSLSP